MVGKDLFPGLPKLSDVIPEISKHMLSLSDNPYGGLQDPERYNQRETNGGGTQRRWHSYINFIAEGRNIGALKCQCCTGVDNDDRPIILALNPAPYSPLALEAAMAICGYSINVDKLNSFGSLAQAMADSHKAELVAYFNPANHQCLPDATILNSTETAEAGVAIVDDAQQTLKRLFSTIAAWNDITELVERVDWEDVQLLNLVAANQACYHSDDDRSVPLLAMIIRLEEYEQDSMGRMRFLFNEWWTEGQSHVSLPPSPLHRMLRSIHPELSERELQAMSLDRTSRFEKAVIRVCRPNLHPEVPYQFSLLDMEQLLQEKPTRSHRLPEALLKAIGHHSALVQVHQSLRLRIFTKVKLTTGKIVRDEHHICKCHSEAKPAPSHDDDDDEFTVAKAVAFLLRPHHSFRTERLFYVSSLMVRCPWIHFLTLVPTSGIPKLQIELLRSKLDVLARANFDCAFVDIMDSGKANFPPWGWMYDAEYYRDQPAVDLHYALSSEMRLILHGGYQISAMTYEALYRAAEQLAVVIPTIDPLLGQSSSSSFIQSGHSYRRDNPSIPRTTRDTARPAVQEVIVSANRPTRALFSINSKQEKLIDRLYRQREGNVGWASVVDLFKRIGFSVKGLGGSAHHFVPTSGEGRSILLYRPHPSPVFTSEQAGAIGDQLQSVFGWTIDDFARQPSTV